jgi:hypothetical protein
MAQTGNDYNISHGHREDCSAKEGSPFALGECRNYAKANVLNHISEQGPLHALSPASLNHSPSKIRPWE